MYRSSIQRKENQPVSMSQLFPRTALPLLFAKHRSGECTASIKEALALAKRKAIRRYVFMLAIRVYRLWSLMKYQRGKRDSLFESPTLMCKLCFPAYLLSI